MLLKRKAEDEFLVDAINTDTMDKFIKQCVQIYQGKPEWLDKKDHVKTINFAKVYLLRSCATGHSRNWNHG